MVTRGRFQRWQTLCLHGTVLKPVQNGSTTVPAFFAGPVFDPFGARSRTGSGKVPCRPKGFIERFPVLPCGNIAWEESLVTDSLNRRFTISFFQPVPWQAGVVNPSRGIHVWPEPNPVTVTSTLCKVIWLHYTVTVPRCYHWLTLRLSQEYKLYVH